MAMMSTIPSTLLTIDPPAVMVMGTDPPALRQRTTVTMSTTTHHPSTTLVTNPPPPLQEDQQPGREASKLDRTHGGMLGLKDVGDARLRVEDVAVAISRCESSLDDAAGRQAYMSSGVRLLVRCVGDLLRLSNPAVAAELK